MLKELPEQKELINFNKDKKNIKKSPYQIQPIFIVGVPRCGSTLVEKIITSVILKNQDKVKQYKSGKEKLFGYIVGEVMKASKGKANPQLVNEILKKKLK